MSASYIHPSAPLVSAIEQPATEVEHKLNEIVHAVNGALSGFMDYMLVARQIAQ